MKSVKKSVWVILIRVSSKSHGKKLIKNVKKTEEGYEASIKREVAEEVEIQKKFIGSINELVDLTAEEIDIFIKDFAEKKKNR